MSWLLPPRRDRKRSTRVLRSVFGSRDMSARDVRIETQPQQEGRGLGPLPGGPWVLGFSLMLNCVPVGPRSGCGNCRFVERFSQSADRQIQMRSNFECVVGAIE